MKSTDGQLLARFIQHSDESAFEELFNQHGPLVMGVCRRMLDNSHEAEDAFQATFIVLVRKAPSLLEYNSLGGWLYQTATRTALKFRSKTIARSKIQYAIEEEFMAQPVDSTFPEIWNEIRPILDQELYRLPERYHTPLVLCYLEGKSYEEAGQILGISYNTIKTRLVRGRDLLRKRFIRKGIVVPSLTILTTWLFGHGTEAVPFPLASSTLEIARQVSIAKTIPAGAVSKMVDTLAKEVAMALRLEKLKVPALLTLILLGTGVGWGVIFHYTYPPHDITLETQHSPYKKTIASFHSSPKTSEASSPENVHRSQDIKEKLLKLLPSPSPSFSIAFGVSSSDGLITFLEGQQKKKQTPKNPSEEIDSLLKAMKGDASDAERYDQLGNLYQEIQDQNHSKESYVRAAALYSQRLEAQPKDPWTQAEFGTAVWHAGHHDEDAEKILRGAVQAGPEDSRCWNALSDFLMNKGLELLGETVSAFSSKSSTGKYLFEEGSDEALLQLLKNGVSSGKIGAALHSWNEALSCCERSIVASPDNPELYGKRLVNRMFLGLIGKALNIKNLREVSFEPNKLSLQLTNTKWKSREEKLAVLFYTHETASDFLKIATLTKSNDYRSLGFVIMAELMANMPKNMPKTKNPLAWNLLPEQAKVTIQETMNELERIAETNDRKSASGALRTLGQYRLVVWNDPVRGESYLRRALSLDPSNEQTQQFLLTILFGSGRSEEVVSLCQQWLERENSVFNREVLGKIYLQQERLHEAQIQYEEVLKLQPEDFVAHLGLAIVQLKQINASTSLSELEAQLSKAEELLKRDPSEQDEANYNITKGVYLALTDHLSEAKKQFEKVLQKDKENVSAKEALAILVIPNEK